MNLSTLKSYILKETEIFGLKIEGLPTSPFFNGVFMEEFPKILLNESLTENMQLNILTHEYSHCRQWIEHDLTWTEYQIFMDDHGDLIDYWIKGNDVDPRLLTECFRVTLNLEKNAEERAMELIKELNIELDLVEYAQKANAYLASYEFARVHRHWPKKSYYLYNELWKQLPKTLEDSKTSWEIVKHLEGTL